MRSWLHALKVSTRIRSWAPRLENNKTFKYSSNYFPTKQHMVRIVGKLLKLFFIVFLFSNQPEKVLNFFQVFQTCLILWHILLSCSFNYFPTMLICCIIWKLSELHLNVFFSLQFIGQRDMLCQKIPHTGDKASLDRCGY